MAIKAVKFTTVSATPIQISANEDQNHDAQEFGRDKGTKVYVNNGSAITIYIGGSDVDSAGTKGFPIAAGATSPLIDLVSTDDVLYAAAASAATPVYVINQGA